MIAARTRRKLHPTNYSCNYAWSWPAWAYSFFCSPRILQHSFCIFRWIALLLHPSSYSDSWPRQSPADQMENCNYDCSMYSVNLGSVLVDSGAHDSIAAIATIRTRGSWCRLAHGLALFGSYHANDCSSGYKNTTEAAGTWAVCPIINVIFFCLFQDMVFVFHCPRPTFLVFHDILQRTMGLSSQSHHRAGHGRSIVSSVHSPDPLVHWYVHHTHRLGGAHFLWHSASASCFLALAPSLGTNDRPTNLLSILVHQCVWNVCNICVPSHWFHSSGRNVSRILQRDGSSRFGLCSAIVLIVSSSISVGTCSYLWNCLFSMGISIYMATTGQSVHRAYFTITIII